MSVTTFADAESASRHQMARELEEALRVKAMGPEEFSAWLETMMPPLQALADHALKTEFEIFPPSARCFGSVEEKNRHDQARELSRALRLALRHTGNVSEA